MNGVASSAKNHGIVTEASITHPVVAGPDGDPRASWTISAGTGSGLFRCMPLVAIGCEIAPAAIA